MNIWKDTYPLIVSCARGLVPQTVGELERLGYRIVDTTEQTAVVRGAMRDMMTLNLQLRTAHRVLAPLLRTECRNARQLYDDVKSIDWENLLEPDGYFTVNSVTRTDAIRDTRMAALHNWTEGKGKRCSSRIKASSRPMPTRFSFIINPSS